MYIANVSQSTVNTILDPASRSFYDDPVDFALLFGPLFLLVLVLLSKQLCCNGHQDVEAWKTWNKYRPIAEMMLKVDER